MEQIIGTEAHGQTVSYDVLVETYDEVKDKPIVGEVPKKATTARNFPESTTIQLYNPGDEVRASTTTPPSW